MSKARISLISAIAAVVCLAALPAGAGAAAIYQYEIENLGSGARFQMDKVDPSKRTTVRVMRAGVQQYRLNQVSGSSWAWFNHAVESGDVIEVYQHPSGDPVLPDPPGVPPTETFTVPQLTVSAGAGNPVVNGLADDGWTAYTWLDHPCDSGPSESIVATRTPGAHTATFAFPDMEGGDYSVEIRNALGDEITRNGRVPGDGRCIDIDAHLGVDTSTTPYEVSIDELDNAIATVRTVLRRSGAALADNNDDRLDLTGDKRPLPGDVIEVYRPQDAGAPAYTYTIPSFSGVVDASGDLMALQVEAGAMVGAWSCRTPHCSPRGERWARAVATGRTTLNFAENQGSGRPFDLFSTDQVGATWISTDERVKITFEPVSGDLVPPAGQLKLGSRLAVRKLSKRLKLKLNSNEAGSVGAVLTVPKMPKKGSAAARKPVTIATVAARSVIAGNNTLLLKPTKKGKAAFKRLTRGKSAKATLTITLKDAAGNMSTLTKNIKIAG
ncbi:MAG: hypothetical protein HY827_09805 [Actinobacteria bacterium]|nr:hypothetical protein [Actinomycetota bacterium]